MRDKIKVLIVEDEPLALSGIETYVADVDFLKLCSSCENAAQANNAIHEFKPDLMFLDIQMPGITGIEFLKSLPTPPMVIISTAYPNYALQGFELDVVDYLVKPYSFARFLKAVNKAHDLFLLRKSKTENPGKLHDYFFVKADNRLERVVFNDILYVEAMENYIIIHTTGQKLITLMTMKNLEEVIPSDIFIRIHKSFIINRQHVKAIDGNQIIIGNSKLPVSRQKKQEVITRMLGK